MGRVHALSGAAAGAAVGEFVLHLPVPATATLAGLAAGFATLNDLDHPCGTASHCLGFASQAFAWVVGKVSGGHRHGTHSVVGVAVFTALAWAACHYRDTPAGKAGLAFTTLLAVAAGLRALRMGGHWAEVLALAAAGAVVWTGWGLALIPMACAVGTAAHLAGDALTDEGIPIAWPLSRKHVRLLPEPFAFTTGTRPERWVVVPALMGGLVLLAWYAVRLPLPHIH
jgi:membrane-bound metal-dependent hydrolase YbcI (DUF457 family)